MQDQSLGKLVLQPNAPELAGVSRATWFRCVKRGETPQRVQLGPKALAYYESDLIAWKAQRQKKTA